MVAAAEKGLQSCLKQRKLNPRNGVFAVRSNGYHVRAGTIRWKRSGPDPFQNPRVLISGASASVAIDYNLTSDKLSPKCT